MLTPLLENLNTLFRAYYHKLTSRHGGGGSPLGPKATASQVNYYLIMATKLHFMLAKLLGFTEG